LLLCGYTPALSTKTVAVYIRVEKVALRVDDAIAIIIDAVAKIFPGLRVDSVIVVVAVQVIGDKISRLPVGDLGHLGIAKTIPVVVSVPGGGVKALIDLAVAVIVYIIPLFRVAREGVRIVVITIFFVDNKSIWLFRGDQAFYCIAIVVSIHVAIPGSLLVEGFELGPYRHIAIVFLVFVRGRREGYFTSIGGKPTTNSAPTDETVAVIGDGSQAIGNFFLDMPDTLFPVAIESIRVGNYVARLIGFNDQPAAG
jgi:hypothetical protein